MADRLSLADIAHVAKKTLCAACIAHLCRIQLATWSVRVHGMRQERSACPGSSLRLACHEKFYVLRCSRPRVLWCV